VGCRTGNERATPVIRRAPGMNNPLTPRFAFHVITAIKAVAPPHVANMIGAPTRAVVSKQSAENVHRAGIAKKVG